MRDDRQEMNITITGGAGFLGANLCAHLRAIDRVESITVIDDLHLAAHAGSGECDEVRVA